MNQIYPKIVVFLMAMTVLVGGTVMLLSSVSSLEVLGVLNGIIGDSIRNAGETLGKTWLPS
jgi:hypothetical protein